MRYFAFLCLLLSAAAVRAHPADMGKALVLVTDDVATHRAVQSGDWSDAATWGEGVPPAGARVVIPVGIAVRQDMDADCLTLRVDGTLTPTEHRAVTLRVGTWVTTMGSKVLAGTETQPFSGQWNIRFRPYSGDDVWRIGGGFIPMGELKLYGARKTAWQFIEGAKAGDDEIRLKGDVGGWVAGDRLVVPGVSWATLDDDECTIASISGWIVKLAAPLKFDHADRDRFDFHRPMFVVNITPRNIDFASESTATSERGHVMCMADKMTGQVFEYCSFRDLGRTDKSKLLTDPDGLGGQTDNPRGRYALHFHRNGPDRRGMERMVYGCLFHGSPGWGCVNHESYCCFQQNAAYRIFGASFAGENGNETGCMRGNVSVRNTSRLDRGEQEFAAPQADANGKLNDFARLGHGFWTQAGGIEMSDNIAAGCADAAHVVMGVQFDSLAEPRVTFDPSNLTIPYNGPVPNNRFMAAWVPQRHERLRHFGCRRGIAYWGLHGNPAILPVQTYARSWLKDSGGECEDYGFAQGYESCVDCFGVRFTKIGSLYVQSKAFAHSGFNHNCHFFDCQAHGFRVGIQFPTSQENIIRSFRHRCLMGIFIGVMDKRPGLTRSITIDGLQRVPLSDAELAAVRAQPPMSQPEFNFWNGREQRDVVMAAVYSGVSYAGSLRQNPSTEVFGWYTSTAPNYNRGDLVMLDGKRLYFPETVSDFRIGDVPGALLAFRGLTNSQIRQQHGVYMLGIIPPADCVAYPGCTAFYSPSGAEPEYPSVLKSNSRYDGALKQNHQTTNVLNGFVLRVKNEKDEWVESAPVNLTNRMWNVVYVTLDGQRRGVLVYADSALPANQLLGW